MACPQASQERVRIMVFISVFLCVQFEEFGDRVRPGLPSLDLAD
jgi:hypothetical protein